MVAPNVSLGTLIFDITQSTPTTVSTNAVDVGGWDTYNSSINRRRYITGSNNPANTYYLDFALSAPVDFTGKAFATYTELGGSNTNRIGLKSSEGERLWTLDTFSSQSEFNVIDPSITTYATDSGTFDLTAVTHLRLEFDLTSTRNFSAQFSGAPFYFNKADGIVLSGGEIGNESRINNLIDSLITNTSSAYGLSESIENVLNGFNEYLFSPLSYKLNTDVSEFFGAFVFSEDTTGAGNESIRQLGNAELIVDTTQISTINLQVKSIASSSSSYVNFTEQSSVKNDINILLENYNNCNFNNSDCSGVVRNGSGVVTQGDNVSLNFQGTTAAYDYEWDETITTPNLNSSTFSGTSTHFINFDEANITFVSNAATADLSSVSFTGTPGTNHFSVTINSPNTLTLIVPSGSGLTLSDVTVTGDGTVIVTEPQLALTATNFADGSRFFAARYQTFQINSADISTTANTIALGPDDETGATFAGQITTPATLVTLTLATGATIPTSMPQLVDGNLYYVSANSSGVIQISETEGGAAINFSDTGTESGGELLTLVAETELINEIVSGGVSTALSLPNDALINVAASHRASASSASTQFTRLIQWSTASGASIADTFSATNNPDTIHNALVGSTITDEDGNQVSITSDGATVAGLSFDLSGNIQLDANAITDNEIPAPDAYLWSIFVRSTEAGIRFVRDQFTALSIMKFRLNGLTLDNVADGVRNSPATPLTIIGNLVTAQALAAVFAEESGTIRIRPFFVADLESAGGGGITQQEVRDALKLAPSAGSPATGSIDDELDGIKAQTDQLSFADGDVVATLDSEQVAVGSIATDVVNAGALATDAVTEIQNGLSTLDAAGVRSAVGLAAANLDTQLGDIPTNLEFNARTIPSADYFDPSTDEVTTDAASRAASQADVSGLATQASVDAIPTNPLLDNDVRLNNLDATVSSRASQTTLDALGTIAVAIEQDTGTTIPNQIAGLNDLSSTDVQTATANALTAYDPPTRAEATADKDEILTATNNGAFTTADRTDLQKARKGVTNRHRIDESANTGTLYDDDGTTPLIVFDLKDADEAPTSTTVYERDPQ